MFVQAGGIENLLKASNGPSLAERFLLIAEKHNLGMRDFCQKNDINQIAIAQYNQLCVELVSTYLKDPMDYQYLPELKICSAGWQKINDFRNVLEPNLAVGGCYSDIALRGSATKIDMQIMKIAANLHLLDSAQSENQTIAIKYIDSAIVIAQSMLEANLKLCTGNKSERIRAALNEMVADKTLQIAYIQPKHRRPSLSKYTLWLSEALTPST